MTVVAGTSESVGREVIVWETVLFDLPTAIEYLEGLVHGRSSWKKTDTKMYNVGICLSPILSNTRQYLSMTAAAEEKKTRHQTHGSEGSSLVFYQKAESMGS
jgi:hypothetical protein